MLKPTGLSVGDWHSLLVNALKSLEEFVVDGAPSGSGRVLPELLGVFFNFEPSGLLEANELNLDIDGRHDSPDGTPNSFVRWRNRRFGHGVFRVDRTVYVRETLRWLDALHRFYEALRPVLDGRRLISIMHGGNELVWRGTQHLLSPLPHKHEPSDDLAPMFLAPSPGEVGAKLPLSPFLSVQPCEWCGQPTAFFFDKYERAKNKKSHKTFCLEYFGGHLYPRRDWQQVGNLADLVPEKFKWKRGSYDQREVAEDVKVVFRDFAREYVRPDYLFDAFWRVLREKQRGYIHLTGEGGTGKTYFVRGLEAEGAEKPGTPVLTYHVLPGARTDYRTFIAELADRARERLNFRTQEPQTNVDSHHKLQNQLVEFLGELMRANRCNKLVVALDAIDELSDPEPNSAAITAFFPSPEKLPRGCFVLLTSRRRLRPKIEEDLERIGGDGLLYTSITLSPEDSENRHVVELYVARYFERLIEQDKLPDVYSSPEYVEAVLERSGGIFLYARHLAGALASGAFTTNALPEAHEFYPAYLDRLRRRVGGELYDTIYLRTLLLLGAAQEPVTLEHLHRWGVPSEGFRLALYDIADFMREHRGRSWHESLSEGSENRYDLAHEAFVRYVQEKLSPQYSEAHARIAQAALKNNHGRWADADPTEETDLYDLRHTLTHLHEAGNSQAKEALLTDEGYASACFSAAGLANDRARYRIAVDLCDQAIHVHRYLVDVKGREGLTEYLADVLTRRGNTLARQGKLDEAVKDLGEAEEIYRRLELDYELAEALRSKANVLVLQGELDQAVQDYSAALRTFMDLFDAMKRDNHELAYALTSIVAGTLTNKGIALRKQGKLDEAVQDYSAAVRIFRYRFEDMKRDDDAEYLAGALNNRAAALEKQGELGEAVKDLGEAEEIYRRLVVHEGREELAAELALALNNRGNVLRKQGELDEAIRYLGEAEEIYRRLVVHEGREELAKDLALVLFNKAWERKSAQQWQEAIDCYQEAIHWLEFCIGASMLHLASQLLEAIRYRMMVLLELKRWGEVAADVTRLVYSAGPFMQDSAVIDELRAFVGMLRELAPEDRELVYAELDEWTKLVVRKWLLQDDAVKDEDELRAFAGMLRELAPEDREPAYARLDERTELVVRKWLGEQ